MSAIPVADPDMVLRPHLLPGERPDPANPPPGCRFHTRCPYADETCRREMPALIERGSGHFVACHHADRLTLRGAAVDPIAALPEPLTATM